MRKVHNSKHKFNPDSTSDVETERNLYKAESFTHHHKKKVKKHKQKERSLEYANSRNGNQSLLRNKRDEFIEIHGCGSDDSNGCDYQDKHSDDYVDTYRCKHHRKKEKKHKKKRKRSRSLSRDRTEEYSKNGHKRLREEEKSVKTLLDSDTEYHYGSSRKKKVLVEKTESESRENDHNSKKLVEKNRSNVDEKFKDKSEFGGNGTIMIKKEKIESETDKNSHEGSTERNSFRKRSSKGDAHEWGCSASKKSRPAKSTHEVQKPNFELSGKLAEDTNTYNGVVIKYSEPPEARMPKKRWRLYPFKGDQPLPPLYIHRQSAYLLGRDRKVVDMPIDHPSCSKQHAALQYRLISYERENGSIGKQIRLYIIDLDSANGTFINNKKIESRKYVELFEKDVIKFGFSSREYVLLHEHSKDDDQSPNDAQLEVAQI